MKRELTVDQETKVKELIRALNSGEWLQARTSLCERRETDVPGETSHAYCCLGVAGALLGLTYYQLETEVSKTDDGTSTTGEYLSNEHALEYGFTYKDQLRLAGLNDDGKSFSHIADRIEEWLDGAELPLTKHELEALAPPSENIL
jgi:hypothetical protein